MTVESETWSILMTANSLTVISLPSGGEDLNWRSQQSASLAMVPGCSHLVLSDAAMLNDELAKYESANDKSDYVLLLSGNCLLKPNALVQLLELLESTKAEVVLLVHQYLGAIKGVQDSPATIVNLLAFPDSNPLLCIRRSLLDGSLAERDNQLDKQLDNRENNQLHNLQNSKLDLDANLGPFLLTDLAIRLMMIPGISIAHGKEPLSIIMAEATSTEESTLKLFYEKHKGLVARELASIQTLKSALINSLLLNLAPKLTSQEHDLAILQEENSRLKKDLAQLQEHHHRCLNSVQVTGKHLLIALASKLALKR